MDLGLDGRTVWITGASGGIGRALARAFHAEGANLLLTAHSRLAELERLAAEEFGDRAECLALDVRDPQACQAVVERGRARFGHVDCAVANAGVWPIPDRPLHELDPERFEATVAVNLIGKANTARAWMRGLADGGPRPDGGGGALVLIGSTAGRFGERFHSDYAAAKAGLVGLVQSLKNELPLVDPAARVNLVEPGWTVTEMVREAIEDDAAVRRALETMALRRLGRADDVARAAVFLCSPTAAAHVTGQVLTVAGGMEGRRLWDGES
ncbi:MAG: SDR family NAD(P)-dependent oxidoreductase, partial [Planctomycetota bacterium]